MLIADRCRHNDTVQLISYHKNEICSWIDPKKAILTAAVATRILLQELN